MKWDLLHEKAEWLFRKITGLPDTPVNGDERLKHLADRIHDGKYILEKIRQQERFDYTRAYQKLVHSKKRFLLPAIWKVAAAILLLIGTTTVFYLLRQPEPVTYNDDIFVSAIKPGERKAYLIKHDGEEIELKSERKIIPERGANIQVDSSGLNYAMSDTVSLQEEYYNTLVVPRGGEYNLTLSDGTKVWLNADSELRYPVQFTGDTREVTVIGEAYFDVQKQADKPFIVKTGLGNITVLGTQFNISSYPEKERLITTLVTGKISYSLPGGKNIILSPDQQLTVNKDGTTALKEVDTHYFTCWKDGIFQFENAKLEDIMDQLARWYDIHVFYTSENVKHLHFSGDLSRFKNIDTFIEMFEKSSDAKLTLKGRTLIVGM
ncbi:MULTISPECIES: FecR family protein [unclassified Butyricimonas]|uniref:FecR family protein n=1 Tax=unclassified Butyricimonas TaxID=2637652 RepID=UPI000C07DD06|nr:MULTISPECIES: FecR family protein [unclassified Butyricimonas]